jgi:CBS domain-containing protein
MRLIQRAIADCIAPAAFVSLAPTDLVSTAVTRMLETQTSCAVVVDGGRLIGIFTGRDFLDRISVKKRDPARTQLGDVMTKDPRTLHPEDCISFAIKQMAEEGHRHVPIVDSEHKPVSVLDTRLVISHLIKVFAELEHEGTVEDERWIDLGGG